MTKLADKFANRLIEIGRKARPAGPGRYEAQCPAHDDRAASLSISTGDDGKLLLNCHAACGFAEIVSAAGLEISDTFPPKNEIHHVNGNGKNGHAPKQKTAWPKIQGAIEATRRLVARRLNVSLEDVGCGPHWLYRDQKGREIAAVVRFDLPTTAGEKTKKTFRPLHSVRGGWTLGDPPGKWPVYRLDKIQKAARVFITEGEKAADAVADCGLAATTSAHGAKSAGRTDWSGVAAAQEIVILPDADDAGENFAVEVAAEIRKVNPAAVVKLIRLSEVVGEGFPKGGDFVEFVGDFRDGQDATSIYDEMNRLADRVEPLPADASEQAAAIQIIPIAEMLATEPVLRPVLIEGMLRVGESGNLVAQTKVGKTWAVLNLALAVALGASWFGRLCTHGRVLLIDNELHKSTLAKRISMVCSMNGVSVQTLAGLIDVVCLRGCLQDVQQIGSLLTSFPKDTYQLVIFDSLYRMLPAGIDENSNSDITKIYNQIDRYAAAMNAAILAVHHASKGVQGSKATVDVGAGAGAQSRAVDLHCVLRQHEEEGVVVMDAIARSFPPPSASCWRLAVPIFTHEASLDPDALRMEGRKKRKAVEEVEPEPWTPARFVESILTHDLQIIEQIECEAEVYEISKRQCGRLLKQAMAEGMIEKSGGTPGNPARYMKNGKANI